MRNAKAALRALQQCAGAALHSDELEFAVLLASVAAAPAARVDAVSLDVEIGRALRRVDPRFASVTMDIGGLNRPLLELAPRLADFGRSFGLNLVLIRATSRTAAAVFRLGFLRLLFFLATTHVFFFFIRADCGRLGISVCRRRANAMFLALLG